MFEARDPGKPKKIIGHALTALGLQYEFLRNQAHFPYPSLESIPEGKMGVYEWVRACEVLCLSLDSISWGFNEHMLAIKVHGDWRDSKLTLPHTPEVLNLISKAEAFMSKPFFPGLRTHLPESDVGQLQNTVGEDQPFLRPSTESPYYEPLG